MRHYTNLACKMYKGNLRQKVEMFGLALGYADDAQDRLNSYLGLLCHSHSYNLRKQAIVSLQNSKWREILNFGVGYHKVNIKPSKTRLMYFRRMNRMRLKEQTLILHTI